MIEVINKLKAVFASTKETGCILGLAFFVVAGSASATGNNDEPTFQISNLQSFVDGSFTTGAIKLYRTRAKLKADVNAADLEPGTAYTTWWVVFQSPDHCGTSPCSGADIGNPDTEAAVFYGSGFLTDSDGVANIRVETKTGKLPTGVQQLTGPDTKVRRSKVFESEIQLIVRAHGVPIPGNVADQLSMFVDSPGCCVDRQFGIFPPIN